jgi:enoyl-CoA hydratase/carnithine racemase
VGTRPPAPHRDAAEDHPPTDDRSTTSIVHLTIANGVATITLDSPANRNALSQRLVAELVAALDGAEAAADQGRARSFVLTHEPPAFCAGADLKERAQGHTGSASIVEVMRRLMDARVPTIAAVHGPVRAGGIGLMASCDLVVVDPTVQFALTEVRVGVAAAIISVPIFRRVHPARLAAAFLTGDTFTADQALAAGLVTHVDPDVTSTVRRLCASIQLGAPRALAATKALLADALDGDRADRDARFERMRVLSEHLFTSPEAAEGMAAFAERRPPRWSPLSGTTGTEGLR